MIFIDLTLEDTRVIAKYLPKRQVYTVIVIDGPTGKEDKAIFSVEQYEASMHIAMSHNPDVIAPRIWEVAETAMKLLPEKLRFIP